MTKNSAADISADELAGRRPASALTAYVHRLNVSRGGVPKLPVAEARLTRDGLVGDRQAKPFIHGGPERALSLYSLELIERLRAEGHPIAPGTAGENVTVAGLDWSRLEPGARLAIGEEAVVEITKYANPCPTITASFAGGDFKRISQKLRPGESRLYARVISEGVIRAGQIVRVIESEPEVRTPKSDVERLNPRGEAVDVGL